MWGSSSYCNRCTILWSDRPMWMAMHPPLKPTSSHHVRGWHSLVYRCLSCTGQLYQPHPMQAYFQRKWRYDDATRVEWQGSHPTPSQQDFPGWINGKLQLLLWMSTGASTKDGWRHQVTCSRHRHWKEHIHLTEWMMSLPIDAIRWWTPGLTQLLTELGHSFARPKGRCNG